MLRNIFGIKYFLTAMFWSEWTESGDNWRKMEEVSLFLFQKKDEEWLVAI
jgi:hypothetical protein